MPNFQAFHADIKVDGNKLPEFNIQVDQDSKRVSCWVPSEAGNVSTAMVVIRSLNIE